ncbi:tripartite tricarboxylate transporter substrate binding protein [Verticiella sediminum]|uniref:Tripartite tricarboxylate transporter substrate binding protein n=1 Tax=Verticiella sediminum TaxID=1247510 RepID=A0A556ABV2_9BURK|nr:tripartite tricarboxylate transporter substrate binding protein [Verticiella sediminum]TSH90372.1 tripartite tricarboxylate transporter substrate binding protein [Verticiella sediminum]
MHRRHFIAALGAAGLSPWLAARAAGTYPERPVRIISPYGPGGSNDTSGRLVAQALSEKYGQQFVLENQPGAGTRIGTQTIARSPGDGYHLLWCAAPFAVNTAGKANTPYDIHRDFVAVGPPVIGPVFLIVNADSPLHSVADFVEYARKQPKGVDFASPGSGSGPHLAAELFALTGKFDALNVHYRGDAQAYTELLGGRVDATLTAITTALPHIAAGRLRVLGVASAQRSAIAPDVPTFAEQGMPEVIGHGWFGLIAPAGTPPAIVQALNADVNAIFADAGIRQRLLDLGLEPQSGSPADFQSFIDTEVERWAKVIEAADITIE